MPQPTLPQQVSQYLKALPLPAVVEQPRLLLAISGGIDSVILLHALVLAGYRPALAHVNYQLRGEESCGDANFVRQLARQMSLRLHLGHARKPVKRVNIQHWARRIRYQWFEQLAQSHGYDYVLLAHQANDQIETLLLNLLRGSGLKGLAGMPRQRGIFVRPLLHTSRQQILDFARQHQLAWRDDSSNASNKYSRNQVRNQLLPLLRELNPQAEARLNQSLQLLQQAQAFTEAAAQQALQSCQVTDLPGAVLALDVAKLLQQPQPAYLLYVWLRPFGFRREVCERAAVGDLPTGSFFANRRYGLYADRGLLVVSRLVPGRLKPVKLEADRWSLTYGPWQFSSQLLPHLPEELPRHANVTWLPLRLLSGKQLLLRPWQKGQNMQPFGASYHKPISDLLTNAKAPTWLRLNWPVLMVGHQVAWLPGIRGSQAFKAQPGEPVLEVRVVLG